MTSPESPEDKALVEIQAVSQQASNVSSRLFAVVAKWQVTGSNRLIAVPHTTDSDNYRTL